MHVRRRDGGRRFERGLQWNRRGRRNSGAPGDPWLSGVVGVIIAIVAAVVVTAATGRRLARQSP